MEFFGVVEAISNIIILIYVVVLTVDVIYDAIYARRHRKT